MPTRISTTSRRTERQLGLVQPTSMMQVDGLKCPLLSKSGQNFAAQRNDAMCQKRTHALQQTAGCWLSIKSTRSEWRLVLCSFTLFCSHFNSLEKSNAKNLG